MLQHGSIVQIQQGGDNDHDQRQQAVVVIGDLLDEHIKAIDCRRGNIAGNGGGPGGNGSDHAHRSGSRVDDVGQLGAGDLVALGDGTHNGAHGQAVEIVVHEDQDAQQHGNQLRAAAGLDGMLGPAAEGLGAAALVHQIHHDAQHDQEDDDAHVVAVGQDGDDAVVGADQLNDGLPGMELRVEQGAHKAAKEQGGINLLADQRQRDGHDGGEQRPEGGGKGGIGLDRFTVDGQNRIGLALKRSAEEDQQPDDHQKGDQIGHFCAFCFHFRIRSFVNNTTALYQLVHKL